ncbi:MAG: TIGR03757 family integrating conjugative element protein [Pigmentiphaga sp.]|uniref:TIGR03757 family integrating conjugative element protein n=1 Tax=Pigmentiphaga sp. TaxID=1977564 RepID=UPI003B5684F6
MSFPTHLHLREVALAFIAAFLWTVPAIAQEVWFITTSAQPPQGTRIPTRLIELDAAQRIEEALTTGLPKGPREAESIARQRLQEGGLSLQRRLQTASQGITDAWSLGITSLPAVVVDRRYVVYGEPDVARAVARIAQYRKAQP